MIRPIGPLHNGWVFKHNAMAARNGRQSEALKQQINALAHRRLLSAQQRDFQVDGSDDDPYTPYPFRPRPPS